MITKQYLQKALQTLPEDNVFAETRSLIRQSIAKIEHIEKKRTIREKPETAQQTWSELLKQGVTKIDLTKIDSKRTIDILSQMIATEQRKLDALAQKGKKQDDENIQTIYG